MEKEDTPVPPCRCGKPPEKPHPCPYAQDIHDDCDSLCGCCEDCEQQCAGGHLMGITGEAERARAQRDLLREHAVRYLLYAIDLTNSTGVFIEIPGEIREVLRVMRLDASGRKHRHPNRSK